MYFNQTLKVSPKTNFLRKQL